MRFQVPQFIDIEDKIFGPFTFKQFVYLAGGAGISYILYQLLPLIVAIPVILGVVGLSLALTFYKINEKPFIFFIEAYVKYFLKDKLYIWKRKEKQKKKKVEKEKKETETYAPKLSQERLRDISWSLDILDMKEKDK